MTSLFRNWPRSIFTFSLLPAIILALSMGNSLAQDVALGEAFIVDDTWYTIQQTSSVGKMIARDSHNGIHLTWTTMEVQDGARHVGYAYAVDGNGDVGEQLAANVVNADVEARAGYSSLELMNTDDGEVAMLFFHGSLKGIAAHDFQPGFGAFSPVYFDPPGDVIPINSKGCVGRPGRMFLVAGVHNPMGGDPDFELTVWPADPNQDGWAVGERTRVALTTGLSHAMCASRTSDQLSILWHSNIIGVPAPDEWAGRLEHQMNNDIFAALAPDGQEWDWDHPLNVTKTILPDPELEGLAALGDTLRPYPDMDAIWVGDVLHVVFTTRGFWADLQGDLVPPVERLTVAESFIWHWDSASDTLTLVADGWFENDIDGSSFNSNVCKPSLGADGDGNLFCLFQKASLAADDPDGYWYGDVCLSWSEDGVEWSEAVNLTDTHPANNQQVEYIHETYPSLAERVDENLHISYLLQAEYTGEQQRVSKFVYQQVPVADLGDFIPLELPREGFVYHNRSEVSVSQGEEYSPTGFRMNSVYPNPFNGTTVISFEIAVAGVASVRITDVNGRVVSELLDGRVEAGNHRMEWKAEGMGTGVYLVSVSVGTEIATKKVVLMR